MTFDDDYSFWRILKLYFLKKNATELVQHVFLHTTLHMNEEHKNNDTIVSI